VPAENCACVHACLTCTKATRVTHPKVTPSERAGPQPCNGSRVTKNRVGQRQHMCSFIIAASSDVLVEVDAFRPRTTERNVEVVACCIIRCLRINVYLQFIVSPPSVIQLNRSVRLSRPQGGPCFGAEEFWSMLRFLYSQFFAKG